MSYGDLCIAHKESPFLSLFTISSRRCRGYLLRELCLTILTSRIYHYPCPLRPCVEILCSKVDPDQIDIYCLVLRRHYLMFEITRNFIYHGHYPPIVRDVDYLIFPPLPSRDLASSLYNGMIVQLALTSEIHLSKTTRHHFATYKVPFFLNI